MTGEANANELTGGTGNDTIDGGAGADTLVGGAGDDTITFDGSDDSIAGGAGTDTLKCDRSRNDRPVPGGPERRRHGECHRLRECGCVNVERGRQPDGR